MCCGRNNFPAEVLRLQKGSEQSGERRDGQRFPFCFAADLLMGSKRNDTILIETLLCKQNLSGNQKYHKVKVPCESEHSLITSLWFTDGLSKCSLTQPCNCVHPKSLPTILVPLSSWITPPVRIWDANRYNHPWIYFICTQPCGVIAAGNWWTPLTVVQSHSLAILSAYCTLSWCCHHPKSNVLSGSLA